MPTAVLTRRLVVCAAIAALLHGPSAAGHSRPAVHRRHRAAVRPVASLTDRLTAALDRASAGEVATVKASWLVMSNTVSDSAPYERTGSASVTVSRDIEKTNSLTSPYLGTVTVDVQVPQTDIFDTAEEAEAAPFVRVYQPGEKYTYAYQGGRWVLKSTEKLNP